MKSTMQTKVDKFGRIVIPQAIREDSGLKPGDALEVSWTGTEIRIRPAHEESGLLIREGILVYEAKSEGSGVESALEDDRLRRMRKIMGS